MDRIMDYTAFVSARDKAMVMAKTVYVRTTTSPLAHYLMATPPQTTPKTFWEKNIAWFSEPLSVSRMLVSFIAFFAILASSHYGYLLWQIHVKHVTLWSYGSKLAR